MKKINNIFGSFDYSKIILLVFIALFLSLLTIFGIKELYSRYAQDDYCYGYRVKTEGFWKTQVDSYFQPTEYSSNWYSLTLLSGITEVLGGPKFVPFLPSLEIISWACALSYLIFFALKPIRSILLSVMVALSLLFFTFYLSPNPYQNLYWLSAIHTYLTPVELTTLMIGRILQITSTSRFTIFNILELSFLGLLAGGFSQTTAVWQFSIWVLTILGLFLFRRNTSFKDTKWPLVTALASTSLAIVIMVINPTNSIRASHYQHAGLLSIINQSLFFGEEFIRVSVKAAPLPFVILFLIGFWLGARQKNKAVHNYKNYILQLIITIMIVYSLCVITMMPYLYAMGVYPGDRALFPVHFTLIAGLFIFGWILAKLIFCDLAENGIAQSDQCTVTLYGNTIICLPCQGNSACLR